MHIWNKTLSNSNSHIHPTHNYIHIHTYIHTYIRTYTKSCIINANKPSIWWEGHTSKSYMSSLLRALKMQEYMYTCVCMCVCMCVCIIEKRLEMSWKYVDCSSYSRGEDNIIVSPLNCDPYWPISTSMWLLLSPSKTDWLTVTPRVTFFRVDICDECLCVFMFGDGCLYAALIIASIGICSCRRHHYCCHCCSCCCCCCCMHIFILIMENLFCIK